MNTIIEITNPFEPIEYKGTIIASNKTELQEWCILDTEGSEHLFINNTLQSCKSDEVIYHETFVHSLMSGSKNISKVLILGGSEGCMIREVLKWNVKEIVQVDWDNTLIEYFKNEGSSWNSNSYNDPRVKIVISDAIEWIKSCDELFDCIFIDLFDPTFETLQTTENLINECKRCLSIGGSLSINAGSINSKATGLLASNMKNMFNVSNEFVAIWCPVPSFKEEWVFLMVVSKLWSVLIHETQMPDTKYYNKDKLIKCIKWDVNYPILNEYWKPKKLTNILPKKSLDLNIYYGC
jgi:spermidine synthase